MDIDTMAEIQAQKLLDASGKLPLDAEGADIAEEKRYSIDLPEYTVRTDPLR